DYGCKNKRSDRGSISYYG
ncbi:hypothetical protein A2U01_0099011, partial [Trifolium medium]|nr:hypothetical protein [Trifolium medium]